MGNHPAIEVLAAFIIMMAYYGICHFLFRPRG